MSSFCSFFLGPPRVCFRYKQRLNSSPREPLLLPFSGTSFWRSPFVTAETNGSPVFLRSFFVSRFLRLHPQRCFEPFMQGFHESFRPPFCKVDTALFLTTATPQVIKRNPSDFSLSCQSHPRFSVFYNVWSFFHVFYLLKLLRLIFNRLPCDGILPLYCLARAF